MKHPTYLSQKDKYNLSIYDFYTSFEKYIFAAILNLYQGGAEYITEVDIDNYFNTHDSAKVVFESNNGIEYLQDALEFCQEENFPFYYRRLKKLNCINDLKEMGYDTSEIYSEDLVNLKSKEINDRFETLEISDIFNLIKKNFTSLEAKYNVGDASETHSAIDGLKDLVGELRQTPDVGASLQGTIFNTICRGARRTKYYIRSMDSGVGKTRSAVGDACMLAYPIRFNPTTWQWESIGATEKTLFIATEQEKDEIQTLILAYLTGINEEKILSGNYNDSEYEIIQQALEVINHYKDNFFIVQMANPNVEQLKAVIRQNWVLHDIKNVFYDYIFSSPSLLNEFRDLRVREDVALGLLSTALKDMAVEMGLFIMSATQTTMDPNNRGAKDKSVIRSAKSIADKCDIGCVISRVSPEEEELLQDTIAQIGKMPNQVTDVYKVRRGKYSKVRIWSYMDLGTCRREDLFITNDRNICFEFTPINYTFKNDNETLEVMEKLNDVICGFYNENTQVLEEKKEEEKEEKKEVKKKGLFDNLL